MKIRKWITGASIIGGLALAASPAAVAGALTAPSDPGLAALAGSTSSSAGFPICLHNSSSYCIKSNGAGNQVTISANFNDWSSWHTVRSSTDGNGNSEFQWENANGNCLRRGTNGVVKLQNGACDSGNLDNWWVVGNSFSGFYLGVRNVSDGTYMLTHGAVQGYNVWSFANPASGDYWRWDT